MIGFRLNRPVALPLAQVLALTLCAARLDRGSTEHLLGGVLIVGSAEDSHVLEVVELEERCCRAPPAIDPYERAARDANPASRCGLVSSYLPVDLL